MMSSEYLFPHFTANEGERGPEGNLQLPSIPIQLAKTSHIYNIQWVQ